MKNKPAISLTFATEEKTGDVRLLVAYEELDCLSQWDLLNDWICQLTILYEEAGKEFEDAHP